MNTFPDVEWHHSSRLVNDGYVEVQAMASGRPKARAYGSGTGRTGTLRAIVTKAKVDEVIAFWNANKNTTFVFNWVGDTGLTGFPGTYHGFLRKRPDDREAQAVDMRELICAVVLWEPPP